MTLNLSEFHYDWEEKDVLPQAPKPPTLAVEKAEDDVSDNEEEDASEDEMEDSESETASDKAFVETHPDDVSSMGPPTASTWSSTSYKPDSEEEDEAAHEELKARTLTYLEEDDEVLSEDSEEEAVD